jgi:hypothetical protein
LAILAIAVIGGFLLALVAFVNRDTPARREKTKWMNAGKNLGLTAEIGRLTGTLNGVTVAVTLVDAQSARPSVQIVASGDLPPSLEVRIWQEGTAREDSTKTGDKPFDRKFLVQGEPQLVLSLLNAEVRKTLQDYAGARELTIGEGTLTMKVLGASRGIARLMEVTRQAAALVAQLAVSPEDFDTLLAASAGDDPSQRVRLRCLELLIKHHDDSEVTKQAIQKALADDSAHVRIAAALRAGSEGTPVLEAVMADPDAPYQLRDKAAFQLSEHVTPARVKELLEAYLVDGHPLRKRAVEKMIARGADPGLVTLMTMLHSDDPAEICVGARCVGAHGYKQAEVALVQLVDHEDIKVKVGAVHALGQVGTMRVLGVLKRTTVSATAGARLKRAANEAVRRIEARATVSS